MRKPALMLRPPCSGRRIVGVRLRAEDRAVVGLGALEQFLAQRRAVLLQARKAGVVEVEREIEAVTAVGGAQHRHRGVGDLGADAVGGEDEKLHGDFLGLWWCGRQRATHCVDRGVGTRENGHRDGSGDRGPRACH